MMTPSKSFGSTRHFELRPQVSYGEERAVAVGELAGELGLADAAQAGGGGGLGLADGGRAAAFEGGG